MEISIKEKKDSGQLLIEMLIVISVAVIIISAAAQLIYVSSRSNKSSGEINVALGLSEETFEAVARYIAKIKEADKEWSPKIEIHTSNYVGAQNMKKILEDAGFQPTAKVIGGANRLETIL